MKLKEYTGKEKESTGDSQVVEKGELQEFIEVIRSLEKRQVIRSIEIIIDNVPDGKKFSKLSDGITKRKYAIGKIRMENGRECSLIDIEREEKALLILILKANVNVKWNLLYSRLLLGLVNESGKWSNEAIKKVQEEGIVIDRSKHIKNNIYEKAKHIYKKLI